MLVQQFKPRSSGPLRYGVEQLGPAGAHLHRYPELLQRLSGSTLIKLEQNGALRRCPPALLPAPRPAARPRAREARQLPHVLLPPALLRRRARRLGGAAAAPLHFPGPPSSTARLARSCTQPSRELCYSTPLPPPFCEPVRLFSGCEPDELPEDLAEELPKELRSV